MSETVLHVFETDGVSARDFGGPGAGTRAEGAEVISNQWFSNQRAAVAIPDYRLLITDYHGRAHLRLASLSRGSKVVQMKNAGLWLSVGLASLALRLPAQVSVEVSLDQEQFLAGEALTAAARIVNHSGQTLKLGAEEAWLTFAVESRDGFIVLKAGDPPVVGEFKLESSQRATKRVDLAPYFSFSRPGRYSIRATVTIKDWDKSITSPPKTFDVIEGAKLWEREIGIPREPGQTNKLPEVRKYTLEQANYLKQLMLYVQLTDSSGKIYKVFPIGPMISFGQPEPQVDKLSNLHLLYQDGPRTFSYSVINPDGTMILRQTYDYTTRPRLKADNDGNFTVFGGTRRLSFNDVPASKVKDDSAAPSPEP
jgi:hypothetical protein